jgi:peptide deformylase
MEFEFRNIKSGIKLIKPLHYKKVVGQAKPIDLEDTELHEKMEKLGWRMIKACIHSDKGGIGLAAPQIGIPLQAFVAVNFDDPWIWRFKDTFRLYINPEYAPIAKTERIAFSENCLSVPRKSYSIKRPKSITAQYWSFDKKGKLKHFHEILSGYQARIFIHEYEHLIGKSIVDIYARQNAKPKRGRPKGSKNKKKS